MLRESLTAVDNGIIREGVILSHYFFYKTDAKIIYIELSGY